MFFLFFLVVGWLPIGAGDIVLGFWSVYCLGFGIGDWVKRMRLLFLLDRMVNDLVLVALVGVVRKCVGGVVRGGYLDRLLGAGSVSRRR